MCQAAQSPADVLLLILRFSAQRIVCKQKVFAIEVIHECLSDNVQGPLVFVSNNISLDDSEECDDAECQESKQTRNENQTQRFAMRAMLGPSARPTRRLPQSRCQ